MATRIIFNFAADLFVCTITDRGAVTFSKLGGSNFLVWGIIALSQKKILRGIGPTQFDEYQVSYPYQTPQKAR